MNKLPKYLILGLFISWGLFPIAASAQTQRTVSGEVGISFSPPSERVVPMERIQLPNTATVSESERASSVAVKRLPQTGDQPIDWLLDLGLLLLSLAVICFIWRKNLAPPAGDEKHRRQP